MAFKIKKKIKIMIKINKIQFQSPPLHLCRLAENKIYLHTTSILKTSKSKIPVPAPRKENKSPVNTGIGSVSQGSMYPKGPCWLNYTKIYFWCSHFYLLSYSVYAVY